jgi:hypothetical protein
MLEEPCIIDSSLALFPNPAVWNSAAINIEAKGSNVCSFHIWWQDVAITWYLWTSNFIFSPFTSPPWIDMTASYRATDPAWVDPVVGDPLKAHIVAFRNIPGKYVVLGFTGGGWGGAAPLLRVALFRDRKIVK